MGLYTRITRNWLEHRFTRRSPAGVYYAHMPVYGYGQPDCETGHTGRLARALRMLRALDRLEFGSLLDVGGAEGFFATVVQRMFGVPTATTDLSHEACLRARELFALPAAAVDSARLPFADGAFDVVVCSEVLEHVEHPVETLLELQRVARVAVLLTTEEIRYDRAVLDDYLFRRPGWPHMERNLFHPDDLADCLPGARFEPQCDAWPPQQEPPADEALAWLRAHTRTPELAPGRIGVVATIPGPRFEARPPRYDDEQRLAALFAPQTVPGQRAPTPSAADDAAWFARLRDPHTGAPLRHAGGELHGSRRYVVRDGVPDFVDVDAPPPPRDTLVARTAALPAVQRDALLSLRDRLYLPERWPQDHFDLRVREQRRGFWPNHDLVPRAAPAPHDVGFVWNSIGPDPWVVTPCLARPIATVELVMRIHNPAYSVDAGVGQLFWKGADDDSFAEERSVKFQVWNDGQVHHYRVPLAGHPGLPAEVQWLRIDPVDGRAEIDLLELRLS